MNILKSKITNKFAKISTVVAVLVLGFAALFFSLNSSSTAITVDCKDVSGDPQPGVNCLYSAKPLCTKNGINWTIPDEASSLLANSQDSDHRVNCFDLSDLPLCSQLSDNGTVGYPGKNCVNECSSLPSESGIRGADYAVHNRDCVRFCDAPESYTDSNGQTATIIADYGKNCTTRKCHQFSDTTQPNPPTNCALFKCNLLTSDELNDTKFTNDTTSSYRYCDNSVKCYEFNQNQLPFLIPETTCKIHNCRVSCVDNSTDDVALISNKGASYVAAYQDYVNSGMTIGTESDILCSPKICKPIVSVTNACLGVNDPKDTPNPECSCLNCNCTATDGASCLCQKNTRCTYYANVGSGKWISNCSNGFCSQTVDCNDPKFTASAFCMTSDDEIVGTTDDSSTHSWFYRPKPHEMSNSASGVMHNFQRDGNFSYDSVCYSINQMESLGWGQRAEKTILGVHFNLGYFHESYLPPRSPKKCHAIDFGIRGGGYDYLCGVKLDFANNAPRDDAAYQYGYVESTFTNSSGVHRETVCLRFDAAQAIGKSCGKRECIINCAFAKEHNKGCNQVCGRDVCVDLKIRDSDPYQCMMNGDLFTQSEGKNKIGISSTSRDCMKIIDGYIRVRGIKYGDYICNFIDFMGDTAYSGRYHDGSEKIVLQLDSGSTETYCESGSYNKSTNRCDGGKNTNEDLRRADRWRAIKRVQYITNNQPSGSSHRGYLDVNGRLFPEQSCIKVGHRITVPRLYNLANANNSPKIFIPTLYIQSAMIKRGGSISAPQDGEDLGETDFHYPEINVNFGTVAQKLSLGFAKTGYEDADNLDALGSATISTTFDRNGGTDTYSLEVFVRKEYSEVEKRPTFCLYKKVKDSDGVYLDPERVECVYRKYPEINNGLTKLSNEDFRKLIVNQDASSTYSNGKIVFQYLSGLNASDNCSSSGASCTQALSLSNPDSSIENCDSTIENHKICVKRDPCSKLNNECITNEINLANAKLLNQETGSYLAIQVQCNQLITSCNARFGINTSSNATVINTNPNNASIDPNAYGWFNEICITSGFSTKLKRVYAKLTDSKTTGKCLIDAARKKPDADCSRGGKNPDCPCLEYVEGATITGYDYRDETPREAGLCVDLPLPQLCPAINHNPTPSTDSSDTNYLNSSLGFTNYGSTLSESNSVVNLSHKIRNIGLNGSFNGSAITAGTTNNFSIPGIPIAGHADFPQQLFGVNNITGTCNGFWKNNMGIPPTINCLNSGGSAFWSDVTNPCVRYSCEAISTTGIDQYGNYQGNFASPSDPANQKGLSHGFATWPALTKINDFPESASAISCATAYKKDGATAILSNGETNADHAALYSHITGYSGGTTPTRTCNQIGQWSSVTNACKRITCSAINLAADGKTITNIPTSSTSAEWELWKNSGGASFPAASAALASLDNALAKQAATSTGTCNQDLGFFQIGSTPPTRVCDSLGNWGEVQNPCVTKCDAITCTSYSDNCLADDSGHGYATWAAVTNVPIFGEADGVFGSCVGGRVPSPYPPLRDKYGKPYNLIDCTTATCPSGSIPKDVKNDTRAAENPKRVCRSITVTSSDSTKITANVWSDTSSSCVNTCPGSSEKEDSRINAGITKHPTSKGDMLVYWSATDFGSWAYRNLPETIDNHDASQYFYGRSNEYYSLARYCNPITHKWDDPIPTCVTNNGVIAVGPTSSSGSSSSYAKYSSPTRVAVSGSILPGTSDGPKIQTDNGTCSASGSYYNNSGTYISTTPPITCSYKDANKKIDETYFNTNGAAICSAMCSSYRNKTYGDGSVDLTSGASTTASAPAYYAPGTTLSLSCINNFGSPVISGSNVSNAFNDCGRSSKGLSGSDRSTLGPVVTCNDNGNGTASWSSVSNDCTSCRNCLAASSTNNLLKQGQWCKQECGSGSDDNCFVIQDHRRNGCGSSNSTVYVRQIDIGDCSHGSHCIQGPISGDSCQGAVSSFFYGCADGVYYYPSDFINCWKGSTEPTRPSGW